MLGDVKVHRLHSRIKFARALVELGPRGNEPATLFVRSFVERQNPTALQTFGWSSKCELLLVRKLYDKSAVLCAVGRSVKGRHLTLSAQCKIRESELLMKQSET